MRNPRIAALLCFAAVVDRACEAFDEDPGKQPAWLDKVVRDGGSRLRHRRESASDLLRELAIAESYERLAEERAA